MLSCNNDVKNGQTNGTQAILEKVVLKPGEQMKQVLLENRIPITEVTASQVAYIILCHCNECISSTTFSIKPKSHTFKGRILKPQLLQMEANE